MKWIFTELKLIMQNVKLKVSDLSILYYLLKHIILFTYLDYSKI